MVLDIDIAKADGEETEEHEEDGGEGTSNDDEVREARVDRPP